MNINWKAALFGTLALCLLAYLAMAFVALQINPLLWAVDIRIAFMATVVALSVSAFILVYLEPRP